MRGSNMKKSKILASAFVAATLSFSSAYADDAKANMEKCHVTDKNGKGLIKAGEGQCASKNGKNACASHNADNDPTAWIVVPKGECVKINRGDFSGVSDDIKHKIKEVDPKDLKNHMDDMHDEVKDHMDDVHKKMK